jgi:hypothetical protein
MAVTMTTYTSQYPPEQSDTYVKATTKFSTSYWPYFATDPTKSLIGSRSGNEWLALNATVSNQRFHIDLGEAKIIRRIYYENSHEAAVSVTAGVENFVLQGSNVAEAFAELTYTVNTDWTNLTTSASVFDIHVAADQVDPKYITVTNSTAYRYYAFKFADNYGNTAYLGVRRIELQTEDGAVAPFISGAMWF